MSVIPTEVSCYFLQSLQESFGIVNYNTSQQSSFICSLTHHSRLQTHSKLN